MEFTLANVFESVADAVPDREAVVCGDRRLTYADLERRSNQLAHALAAQGIGPGDHVGLHLYNGTEYLEGMIACFKLRAVPINVNYRYVAEELRYLFTDSDAKAVIHEPDFADTIAAIRDDLPLLKTTVARGDEYEAFLAGASGERDFTPRSGDDLYILYTGGTTGMPKGVMWRQEDILFAAMAGGVNPADTPESIGERVIAGGGTTRCLPACPFMHGTAHWMALSTMHGGGTIVISPDHHLDPERLLGLIAEEKVSFLVIVGDAFARPLVDVVETKGAESWDLSSLKVMLSGGAILSPSVKADLKRLLPSTLVMDGYGASETGGQGSMVAGGEDGGHPRFRMGPDTMVIDDDGKPVEPGETGWVARKGRIPLGYYNDTEKTAATFKQIGGERWSIPGDRGTVDAEGIITLYGRGSVSINTGGEKVFPEEVEAACKSHPAVFDAVVVGIPDQRWGERVTAVVRPRDGMEAPSAEELAEHCRKHVAGYKVPRTVVVVDDMVRSPSGKPDYRWAKEQALKATAGA